MDPNSSNTLLYSLKTEQLIHVHTVVFDENGTVYSCTQVYDQWTEYAKNCAVTCLSLSLL